MDIMYLLVLLHLMISYSSGVDYYVKPAPFWGSKCPSGDQPCKTLDKYANDSQHFEDKDIRMLFLDGVYNWTKNLNFSQLDSVQMITTTPGSQVKIQLLHGDRTIELATRFVLIQNLLIAGDTTTRTSVVLLSAQEMYMHRVHFAGASLIIMVRSDIHLENVPLINITINNSHFVPLRTISLLAVETANLLGKQSDSAFIPP